MNLRLRGAWNQLKGRIRQSSARATGDTAAYGRGQDERIIGSIESSVGRVKDRARKL